MAYQPDRNSLRLKVTDFGPIVNGEVDLRPLTVFVGPSNTGKSWMAVLIYSLHKHFGFVNLGDHFGLPASWIESLDISSYKDDLIDFLKPLRTRFHDSRIREGYLDDHSQTESMRVASPPKRVIHLLQSALEMLGKDLRLELCRCLGSDESQLRRKGSKSDARIIVRNVESKGTERVETVLAFSPQQEAINAQVSENLQFPIDLKDNSRGFYYDVEYMLDTIGGGTNKQSKLVMTSLLVSLVRIALPTLIGILRFPAFYLPADRTGIMHAHSIVVSALIDRAAMGGLRPSARTPVLSGVLADFLQQLIALGHGVGQRVEESVHHATRIEDAILHGAIRMHRAETSGYPRFTYQPNGWTDEIPLMNASSMISELAPVILYLRYRIVSNNVIIVEEPESHLHPAMQVEFTRQLAKLVQAGVRVIITTHSEWVLEELANIVRKSALTSSERRGISNGDVSLQPDQVGAWLFKSSDHLLGSVITEISLDSSGLFPSGFDEVAAELHNNWADISGRMQGGE